MFSLKNKVAIITGSSKGIGFAIAKAFISAGANVVINSRHEIDCKSACRKLGKCAMYVCGDISKEKDVQEIFAKAIKKFKKIDILVNNAGIFNLAPFETMGKEQWQKMIDIDLTGVFLCTKEAVKAMKNGGKIINLASIAGLVGYPGAAHYCAAKGAIVNLTRELSLEFAPKKINVNAIAPGAIDTEMISFIKNNPNAVKQTMGAVPMKRFGKPEDIAYAALYLASDEADYVTGHTLVVDGGYISQ